MSFGGPGRSLLASWFALVMLGCLYGTLCGESCPSTSTIRAVSPPTIAKSIAIAGPLPMWLLLFLHQWWTCAHNQSAMAAAKACAPLLLPAIVAYLAISMWLRYLHFAVPYDPSGHIAVVGLQMAPLCVSINTRLKSGWLAVAVVITGVWFWFTLVTAAFFHTFIELVPSLALAVWCYVDTTAVCHLSPPTLPKPLAFRVQVGLGGWVGSLVVLFLMVSPFAVFPPVYIALLYDAVIIALGLLLLWAADKQIVSE